MLVVLIKIVAYICGGGCDDDGGGGSGCSDGYTCCFNNPMR